MKLSTFIAAFLCVMGLAVAEDTSVQMGVEQTSGDILMLGDGNFQEAIASGRVVVEFYATWCGACQHFMPTFDATAAEHKGSARFAKANSDNAKTAMKQYGIRSYPTVVLFEDGKEVRRFVGGKDKHSFEEFLQTGGAQARAPAPTQKKTEHRVSKPARGKRSQPGRRRR